MPRPVQHGRLHPNPFQALIGSQEKQMAGLIPADPPVADDEPDPPSRSI